jgi:hypothetical protein
MYNEIVTSGGEDAVVLADNFRLFFGSLST